MEKDLSILTGLCALIATFTVESTSTAETGIKGIPNKSVWYEQPAQQPDHCGGICTAEEVNELFSHPEEF